MIFLCFLCLFFFVDNEKEMCVKMLGGIFVFELALDIYLSFSCGGGGEWGVVGELFLQFI